MNAYLLHLLFGTTFLTSVALIAEAVLRHRSSALRHSILAAAVFSVLLVPLLLPLLPHRSLGIFQSRERDAIDRGPTSNESSPFSGPEIQDEDQGMSPMPPRSTGATKDFEQEYGSLSVESLHPLPFLIENTRYFPLAIWGFGTGLLLLRLAVSVRAVKKILAKTTPLEEPDFESILRRLKIPKSVGLRQSETGVVPFTFGILKPVVVLPESSKRWASEERRAVLTHELGHVIRRDVFWQLAAEFCCAVYWFHPLIWLTAWRLRIERELACDDLVVLAGEEPPVYASILLRLASGLQNRDSRRHVLGCTVAMARHHEVKQRIAAILDPKLFRKPLGRLGALILSFVAAAGVTAAAMLSPNGEETTVTSAEADGRAEVDQENDDSSTSQIIGRLVDESGKPLSGTEIQMRPPFAFGPKLLKSDVEGRFQFPVPENGVVLIRPYVDDLAGRTVTIDRRGDIGDIVVRKGIRPTVRVLDLDGNPVPNITVTLWQNETSLVEYRKGQTDAEGRFTFQPVLPDEKHPYFIGAESTFDEQAGGLRKDVSDPRPRAAFVDKRVKIHADTDEFELWPVEVVSVTVRMPERVHESYRPRFNRGPESNVSPSKGFPGLWSSGFDQWKSLGENVYRFDRLPRGLSIIFTYRTDKDLAYRLMVDGREPAKPILFGGGDVGALDADSEIVVTAHEPTHVSVRIVNEQRKPANTWVCGYYLDLPRPYILEMAEGRPVIRKDFLDKLKSMGESASFGPGLHFSFAWDESTGEFKSRGMQPDMKTMVIAFDRDGRLGHAVVQGKAGEKQELTLTLKKTVTAPPPESPKQVTEKKTYDEVQGRVVDENGEAIKGVLVKAEYPSSDDANKITETKTNVDGRYVLKGPFHLETFKKNGKSVGWVSPSLVFLAEGKTRLKVRISDESNELNAVLRPGVRLQGRVIDDRTGKGAANTAVRFCDINALDNQLQFNRDTKTDTEGNYRTPFNFKPGRYVVFILDENDPKNETLGKIEPVEVRLENPMFRVPDLHVNQCGWIEGSFVDAETGEPVVMDSVNVDHVSTSPNKFRTVFNPPSFLMTLGTTFKARAFPGENMLRLVGGRDKNQIKGLDRYCTKLMNVEPGETVSLKFEVIQNVTVEALGKLPEPVEEEREAAEAVRRFGGWYKVDADKHVVEVNMIYRSVDGVYYTNPQRETDAVMPFLPRFSRLKSLAVYDGQVTDASVKYLAELTRLEFLSWVNCRIGDAGAARLGGLKELRKIHMNNAKLTDASLKIFAGLPELRELSLQNNRFTNRGLEYLREAGNLEKLWWCLGKTKPNDESLKILAELPNLREIEIQEADITAAGFENLARSPSLKKIGFEWSGDEKRPNHLRLAESLAKIETLEVFSSVSVEISEDEARTLAQALPKLKELGSWNAEQLQRLRK